MVLRECNLRNRCSDNSELYKLFLRLLLSRESVICESVICESVPFSGGCVFERVCLCVCVVMRMIWVSAHSCGNSCIGVFERVCFCVCVVMRMIWISAHSCGNSCIGVSFVCLLER